MAQLIYSGGSGSPTTQNSLEKIRIRYTPLTPFEFKAGTAVQISDVIAAGDKLTLNFQATKNGSTVICSLMPLAFLAHVDGLRQDTQAYMEIAATATAGTNKVEFVEFNVLVFRNCKRFDAGNTLNINITVEAANVKIWAVDSPFQSVDAAPYVYNSKTTLANNSETIPENIALLFLPATDDDAWQLQISGDAQSQWTLTNFFSMFGEDGVTNVTPYQKTNYVAINTKDPKLTDLRLQAGAANILYFTIQ